MGNGFIILGLFGIASVIAGKQTDVYNGVTGALNDNRIFPTVILIVGLMWIGNLSNSQGWKTLTRALSILIGIALLFSVTKNPYTFLPSFMQGTKQNG